MHFLGVTWHQTAAVALSFEVIDLESMAWNIEADFADH
jgi:hypothetical protein